MVLDVVNIPSWMLEGSPQRECKDDYLPKIQRVTPNVSQKEKVTTVLSQAGRKPSQVLRTQNDTSKKVRALPGGQRELITSGFWKGRDNSRNFIFPSWLGTADRDPGEWILGRTLTLCQPLPVFPWSHPQPLSGLREGTFSIYQNLARFSIHFWFPWVV